MHLYFKLDEIFAKGSLWKHRTLRTIFDKNASEWNHTKIALLIYKSKQLGREI